MATHYRRDDPGAPTYSFSGAAAHYEAFKIILKACLVTGYGSKAAAGWSLVEEGVNHLVLRNGTKSGYVCFSNANSTVTVYLAETFLGMSGNVMLGDGLRTGSAANNSAPQSLNVLNLAAGAALSWWDIFADEATFVLAGSGFGFNAIFNSNIGSGSINLYVGDDNSGNFVSMGGRGGNNLAFSEYGFTVLKDPITGLLLGSAALPVVTPSMISPAIGTATYGLRAAVLHSVEWLIATTYSAALRGVVQNPNCRQLYPYYAHRSLGGIGTVSTAKSDLVDLGTGFSYLVAPSYYQNQSTWIATNDPEFW